MSPFRSKYKVTQEFGVNEEYYSQFGLKGHEGVDLIPTGTVWDVLVTDDGVVVLDDDVVGSPSSDPYGKIVTVWHSKLNKATMYCHLQENFVVHGQTVTKGQKIGTMGSTGNSTGAHLHLNLFETTETGVRLNRNNGYNGGIDPIPYLESPTVDLPAIDPEILSRADNFVAVCTKLNVAVNKDVVMAELDKLIKYEDSVIQKDKQIIEQTKQIKELESKLETLQSANVQLKLDNDVIQNTVTQQQRQLETQDSNLIQIRNEIDTLKKQMISPDTSGWKLISIGLSKVFGLERK